MIHPTAIIHPNAQLGERVEIGPYAIIGEHVCIGDGSVIGAHTVVEGRTTIGKDNQIGPHAVIGGVPQDKKYANEPTTLEIGDRNTIREFCSIHIGTAGGGGVTRMGNDNWIMSMVHIAHDCQIGNNTTMANFVGLAGHVTVEDYAILGGYTGVHQFCRIGAYAFTAATSAVVQDVTPYTMVGGRPIKPIGLNSEGLRRHGFSADTIHALKHAYKTLYRSGLRQVEALEALRTDAQQYPEVARFIQFIESTERGLTR